MSIHQRWLAIVPRIKQVLNKYGVDFKDADFSDIPNIVAAIVAKSRESEQYAGILGDMLIPEDILQFAIDTLHHDMNVLKIVSKYSVCLGLNYYEKIEVEPKYETLWLNHRECFQDTEEGFDDPDSPVPRNVAKPDYYVCPEKEIIQHFRDHCGLFFTEPDYSDDHSAGSFDYFSTNRRTLLKKVRRLVCCDVKNCNYRPLKGSILEKDLIDCLDCLVETMVFFYFCRPNNFAYWMNRHFFVELSEYKQSFSFWANKFQILWLNIMGLKRWTSYLHSTVENGSWFLLKAYKLRTSNNALHNGAFGESINLILTRLSYVVGYHWFSNFGAFTRESLIKTHRFDRVSNERNPSMDSTARLRRNRKKQRIHDYYLMKIIEHQRKFAYDDPEYKPYSRSPNDGFEDYDEEEQKEELQKEFEKNMDAGFTLQRLRQEFPPLHNVDFEVQIDSSDSEGRTELTTNQGKRRLEIKKIQAIHFFDDDLNIQSIKFGKAQNKSLNFNITFVSLILFLKVRDGRKKESMKFNFRWNYSSLGAFFLSKRNSDTSMMNIGLRFLGAPDFIVSKYEEHMQCKAFEQICSSLKLNFQIRSTKNRRAVIKHHFKNHDILSALAVDEKKWKELDTEYNEEELRASKQLYANNYEPYLHQKHSEIHQRCMDLIEKIPTATRKCSRCGRDVSVLWLMRNESEWSLANHPFCFADIYYKRGLRAYRNWNKNVMHEFLRRLFEDDMRCFIYQENPFDTEWFKEQWKCLACYCEVRIQVHRRVAKYVLYVYDLYKFNEEHKNPPIPLRLFAWICHYVFELIAPKYKDVYKLTFKNVIRAVSKAYMINLEYENFVFLKKNFRIDRIAQTDAFVFDVYYAWFCGTDDDDDDED